MGRETEGCFMKTSILAAILIRVCSVFSVPAQEHQKSQAPGPALDRLARD